MSPYTLDFDLIRFRHFDILSFSHFEFEILGISREIPSISKTWNFNYIADTKKITMSLGYFYLLQMFEL